MDSVLEESFVCSFVIRGKRLRILEQLRSRKNRKKFRDTLAQNLIDYLDVRYVFERAKLNSEQRKLESRLRRSFERDSSGSLCYIIYEEEGLDGLTLPLEEAELRRSQHLGAVVILIPTQFAYYYTEDDDPDYVLMRSTKSAS